jgi:hypothetical protein
LTIFIFQTDRFLGRVGLPASSAHRCMSILRMVTNGPWRCAAVKANVKPQARHFGQGKRRKRAQEPQLAGLITIQMEALRREEERRHVCTRGSAHEAEDPERYEIE